MPAIVDKSSVTKICVDDFAFRKRYAYGTVMVDLETHRIIDILDSRETGKVEDWLRSYPNLQVISRDGAQAYASASANSHPGVLQVSDRFHLLKNLAGVVEEYMYRLFPSRLAIPATSQNMEMQVLYDTRNRSERIKFAHKKRTEGYTVNDIALLLHSSATTINRYLSIPEHEVPEQKENARERQHIDQMKKKQDAINEVRKLYSEGHSINEITRLTGHVARTVKNYLKKDCSLVNGHYDRRLPGKLAPYEQEDGSLLSVGDCLHQLRLGGEHRDLRFIAQMIITHEFCGNGRIDLIVNSGIRPHIVRRLTGVPSFLSLLLHRLPETVLINAKPFLLQDLLGQIQRESIGIVQGECISAGEYLLSLLCHVIFHSCKDGQTLVNGLIELLFLLSEDLEDKILLLLQLRIAVLAAFDHRSAELSEEISLNAQKPSMAGCTADQTA